MDRRLSPLQRFILRRTGAQHRLYYAEVFVDYFGWQPVGPWAALHRHVGELANPGGQRFSRDAIGPARYHSNQTVLSRACRRLVARGLITWVDNARGQWAAVAITDAGRAWLAADAMPTANGAPRGLERPPRTTRHPSVERVCCACGVPFLARRDARTCSPACRQHAYRQRQHTP
jgi:hypothetical protein